MKLTCLLLLFLSGSACFSQIIIDYYLPSQEKNESVLGYTGMKELKKKVYYKVKEVLKKDIYSKVKEANVTVTTLYFRKKKMREWTKQLVVVDSLQVSVIRSISNKSDAVQIFKPNETVILKMPPENGKTEWQDPDHSSSITSNYTSEFSIIKVDGKETKSIKVTTRQINKQSKIELLCKIDYYVAGIGHYKMTTETGILIETLEEQTNDPNPPVLNLEFH